MKINSLIPAQPSRRRLLLIARNLTSFNRIGTVLQALMSSWWSIDVVIDPGSRYADGLEERLGLNRRMVAVADVRKRSKSDLPLNDALPRIEVEPDTFTVRIDGEVIEADPVTDLPMAQRYFLF